MSANGWGEQMPYDDERDRLNRRDFFRAAGVGAAAAAIAAAPRDAAAAQEAAKKAALDRIASNSYPIRNLFKTRPPATGGARGAAAGPAGRGGAGRGDVTGDAPLLDQNPNAAKPLAVAAAAERARAGLPNPQQMKEKYGEITMLDFPQFTKDTFPGVTR